MNKKRNLMILAVFSILTFCLIFKIAYLQLYLGNKLTKAAYSQRGASANFENPRGDILDKNSIPFTNRYRKTDIVLKPLFLRDKKSDIYKIAKILGLNYSKLRRDVEIKKQPLMFSSTDEGKNYIMDMNLFGVSSVNSLVRYDMGTKAKHVLGYLNKSDGCGGTGLEKFYEHYLNINKKQSVWAVVDARENLVRGLGYRINLPNFRDEKLNLKLTLDYHIQKIAEDIMGIAGLKGAVVIVDISNGDIIAMVSKPDYDPNDIGKYLNSKENELFNRAVASYNLGSVFKILSLAKAIESGVDLEEGYYCPGYFKMGKKEFKCCTYVKGGHGWLNHLDAFSKSCNPYFINLGLKIGYQNMMEISKRFGLGERTGVFEQGLQESAGNLPKARDIKTDGDMANIAIGQGDILATPLQVANIVATIANAGVMNKNNIVDSIVDSKGEKVKIVRVVDSRRVVEKEIAEKIKRKMECVTQNGTGIKANIDEYGGAGGKTGSAETGQYLNGEMVEHAWFAGFFPKKKPRYSLVVFVENGKSGGMTAAPIFSDIAKGIIKKGF